MGSPFFRTTDPIAAHCLVEAEMACGLEVPCAACAQPARFAGSCTPPLDFPEVVGAIGYGLCALCHLVRISDTPDRIFDTIDARIKATAAWSLPVIDLDELVEGDA